MHEFMKAARYIGVDSGRPEGPTLVEMLKFRSQSFPDRVAFQFLEDHRDSRTITYRQLDHSARRIAAALQERFEPGSSAAIVFPPGLGFVEAFFGCVYAGIVSIPATYPKPRRPSARLSAIVADARPAVILTTQRVLETLCDSSASEALDQKLWLSTDELEASSRAPWRDPGVKAGDIAFLQYTSGSTKDPRGVEVSHANIAHNLEMIRQGFALSHATEHEAPEVGVSWLPAYHDMGLIGGILESIYVGGTTILMSPLSLLRRPERWLRAISDHRAVVSGGPNFAYELCVRKIRPRELEGLDLSSWRVAFSGAEPIRAETLRRFSEAFGSCGFSESAFYPCYGLAEATLLVTGGQGPGKVTKCSVQAAELQENGRAVAVAPSADQTQASIELVGCGRPLMGEEVLIVDPDTRLPCEDSVVGEIWIRGRNVARGYRNRSPSDGETFSGQLADSREDSFLRSGDLGFIRDGSLFVTGRLKELLIIRGRNHYPHDFEATVQGTHAKLTPGGGAAILIDQQGDELLVLVQEVDRATNPSQRESMIRDIRRNVTAEHDVFVHEVILIRTGTLPRTTSGKVRHADVKREYLAGDLGVISRWSFAQKDRQSQHSSSTDRLTHSSDLKQLLQLPKIDDREKLAEEIQVRLMTWLRQIAEVQDNDLGPHRPFAEYGLDSLSAVELIGQLEEGLGLKLSPTVAWTYPTPASLARYISGLMTRSDGPDQEPQPAAPAEDTFDHLLSQLEQLPEDEVAAMLASDDRGETNP
jgi:acyl-CoA synthetase (AMP-forming)/AMP-acid ligase II/acyl carrier protein